MKPLGVCAATPLASFRPNQQTQLLEKAVSSHLHLALCSCCVELKHHDASRRQHQQGGETVEESGPGNATQELTSQRCILPHHHTTLRWSPQCLMLSECALTWCVWMVNIS